MMFLTRGVLFHEPTWKLWFKYAEGLVPIEPFRSTGCNSSVFAEINKYCLVDEHSPDVIAQQHLFNAYVHTAPSFPGFGEDSIFYGKEIPNRVEVRRCRDANSMNMWCSLQSAYSSSENKVCFFCCRPSGERTL